MEQFENYLQTNLPKIETFHPIFGDAMQKMVKAKGKRFRPMLLLLVVNTYSKELYKSSLPVAFALELFHTYSLIHDDLPVMDNANLRRGEETLHITYDEVTALLVGDALNTDAFLYISKAPLRDDIKVRLIEELAKSGGSSGMVLGQAIDCYFENRELNLDEVKTLHLCKTAKLIASSLKMGAIIANLGREIEEKLYSFGLELGLLFQIQDDIIDITLTSKEALKSTQKDDDKNSFTTLLGLDGAIKEADNLVLKLEKELNSFDKPLKETMEKNIQKYLYRHKEK